MQISLATKEARYLEKMSHDEIRQALFHVRVLAAMRPPMEIAYHLAIFTAELVREVDSWGEREDGERELSEFSPKELREALASAKAIRELRPRYGVQVCVTEYILAIIAEQESRIGRKGNRAARIAKSLADDQPSEV